MKATQTPKNPTEVKNLPVNKEKVVTKKIKEDTKKIKEDPKKTKEDPKKTKEDPKKIKEDPKKIKEDKISKDQSVTSKPGAVQTTKGINTPVNKNKSRAVSATKKSESDLCLPCKKQPVKSKKLRELFENPMGILNLDLKMNILNKADVNENLARIYKKATATLDNKGCKNCSQLELTEFTGKKQCKCKPQSVTNKIHNTGVQTPGSKSLNKEPTKCTCRDKACALESEMRHRAGMNPIYTNPKIECGCGGALCASVKKDTLKDSSYCSASCKNKLKA